MRSVESKVQIVDFEECNPNCRWHSLLMDWSVCQLHRFCNIAVTEFLTAFYVLGK